MLWNSRQPGWPHLLLQGVSSLQPHASGGGADGALIGGVFLVSMGPHLIKWPGKAIDPPSGTRESLSAAVNRPGAIRGSTMRY